MDGAQEPVKVVEVEVEVEVVEVEVVELVRAEPALPVVATGTVVLRGSGQVMPRLIQSSWVIWVDCRQAPAPLRFPPGLKGRISATNTFFVSYATARRCAAHPNWIAARWTRWQKYLTTCLPTARYRCS